MRAMGLAKILGFYVLCTAVALVAMWQRDDLGRLIPAAGTWRWSLDVGVGLAVGLAMVGASRLATAHFGWAERLAEEMRQIVGELDRREIVALALWSGIGEEALFRGVLQPALGLWLSAAIFALLHIGPSPRFLPWTAMAFGVGVIFGLLNEWLGCLLAPIIAHALVNLLNLDYLTRAQRAVEVHLVPVGGEHLVEH